VSNPFLPPRSRYVTFHGRISKHQADSGFENYLNVMSSHFEIRIFLNGKEYQATTADPYAGAIKVYCGSKLVTLKGNVEIKLER
jgi:hypothetical protein